MLTQPLDHSQVTGKLEVERPLMLIAKKARSLAIPSRMKSR